MLFGKGNPMKTPKDTPEDSQERIERRASELARIDGRSFDDVTEEDRFLAAQELQGETLRLSSDEDYSDVEITRNPADIASETGHAVKKITPPDEQLDMELEVEEGMSEAEHEHMLQGQDVEQEEER
jgi:hypothetical protein